MVNEKNCLNCGVLMKRGTPSLARRKCCGNACGHAYRTRLEARLESFWSRVDKGPHPKGCWLWTGCTYNAGYGSFWWRQKMRGTNRVSWEVHNGREVPEGLDVCHTCDVPLCVNPEHLWLGTHHENMQDKVRKGRHKNGRTAAELGHRR
jgi:hypothetical protein